MTVTERSTGARRSRVISPTANREEALVIRKVIGTFILAVFVLSAFSTLLAQAFG
jgi:hypothetical protein